MPKCKKDYKDMDKYRAYKLRNDRKYYGKTQKYKRRIWTIEEEEMVLAHDIPDHELSAKIHRSVKAIQVHRSKLKKEEKIET